jgi:hypothetical protein
MSFDASTVPPAATVTIQSDDGSSATSHDLHYMPMLLTTTQLGLRPQNGAADYEIYIDNVVIEGTPFDAGH